MLLAVYLARHGETAWSLSSHHTEFTDLPVTDQGKWNTPNLEEQLRRRHFARVYYRFVAPRRADPRTDRPRRPIEVGRDLVEWNYGEYDGLRTADIRAKRPGWQLCREGCPPGKSISELGVREDRVIDRVRAQRGDLMVF